MENFDEVRVEVRPTHPGKFITVISGLEGFYDLKIIIRSLKKSIGCNGAIVIDKNGKKEIHLQGAHPKLF